jgi:hypothetical protein
MHNFFEIQVLNKKWAYFASPLTVLLLAQYPNLPSLPSSDPEVQKEPGSTLPANNWESDVPK